MGRKVSDKFTVPVCRLHHRELHRRGNERGWWENQGIDPLRIAATLWDQTHEAAPADSTIQGEPFIKRKLNGRLISPEPGAIGRTLNRVAKPISRREAE
jgi:hypothetical protein